VVWGQVLVGAWLFLLFLVVMRVPVDLYQVQIRFSVLGTNQVQCTRYKRGSMYQVQIKFSVPGTKGG
jgi:hypothetical protein